MIEGGKEGEKNNERIGLKNAPKKKKLSSLFYRGKKRVLRRKEGAPRQERIEKKKTR